MTPIDTDLRNRVTAAFEQHFGSARPMWSALLDGSI